MSFIMRKTWTVRFRREDIAYVRMFSRKLIELKETNKIKDLIYYSVNSTNGCGIILAGIITFKKMMNSQVVGDVDASMKKCYDKGADITMVVKRKDKREDITPTKKHCYRLDF